MDTKQNFKLLVIIASILFPLFLLMKLFGDEETEQ